MKSSRYVAVAVVLLLGIGFGSAQTFPTTNALVGTGAASSLDGDALTVATMNAPTFVAADMIGNLYITVTSRHVIRFYNAALETLTTVIGQSGSAGSGEGTGTSARLNSPTGITVERKSNNQGRVFICDRDNRRVRVYDPVTRAVSTFAGSGTNARVDGTGTAASFTNLQDIVYANDYLYIAESSGTVGYIRRIDLTTRVVSTLITNPTRAIVSVAINAFNTTELYYAIAGNIFAYNLATATTRTLTTFALECSGLAVLPSGLLAYTCPNSNSHAVYFRDVNGVETVLGTPGTLGYQEGPTGPAGVLFNKPTGISVSSISSEYARYVVVDSGNNRVRLIQTRFVNTTTAPMTHTRSVAPTASMTKTRPDTTTTTAAPTTTTTTTTATTTTTTTAAPTESTTTPTPTFVPALNTSFVEFRFPTSAVPFGNSTMMLLVMVRMEADILNTLGVSSASTSGVYILPEYRIFNESGEVVFRVQVPNSQASQDTIQAIALTSWPITTAYLQATQSNLLMLCTSCSGSNCNVTARPRCASENNNGVSNVVIAPTFPCEEVWCILAVFLGCLVAGIIIAGGAYYASTSTSYRQFQSRTKTIREDI